jgi:hypothetical protein
LASLIVILIILHGKLSDGGRFVSGALPAVAVPGDSHL